MKRLFLLITLALFSLGALTQAFAAPARNAVGGGLSTKRIAKPKAGTKKRSTTRTAQKATAQKAKTKAQERAEARAKQFGLMPSELDSTNHSVFHADAAAIKGARDTESALRYLPFVTIINTAGFGQQFDLRAQGRLSANGVKLYINGITANPVDSYFNPMPIATIIPSLIDEVSVTPGGGAVLYGSGAKGGTINIITSKRNAPYFVVGGGYVNTMASKGNSFNAFAHASERLSRELNANAGLAFQQMGGPREDDKQTQGQAILGAEYKLGLGQTISLDLDFFYGKTKTTPYGSLIDEDRLSQIVLDAKVGGSTELTRHQAVGVMQAFEPVKENRKDKGNGDIETTQIRATGDVAWKSEVTQNLNFEAKAFYSLYQQKFDKYELELPYFVLGYEDPTNSAVKGYQWFLPMPNSTQILGNANENVIIWDGDGHRTDWHYLDQSGTTTKDYKFGAQAQMDFKHGNGELVAGVSTLYEMSNRNSKSHLRQAIRDQINRIGADGNPSTELLVSRNALQADIDSKIDMKSLTTSVFVFERYDLNRNFSLGTGVRYELKNYNVKANDSYEVNLLQFANANGQFTADNTKTDFTKWQTATTQTDPDVEKTYKEYYDNFTFELAPVYRYSNSGAIYARGELGYIAPPAWAMLQRIGIVRGAVKQPDIFSNELDFDFSWLPTNLKSETYYTAELGFKETIGTRAVPLGFTDLTINALLFSASVFYTDSKDEFYFTGDTWSGMELGTYEKSRRMGVEVAMEQYLFGGALGFNESFTYLKAEKFDCTDKTAGVCNGEKEWSAIPYTYDYKATLGATINASTFIEITDMSVYVWLQNSIYGNQNIYATQMSVNTPNGGQASDTNPLIFQVLQQDDKKLKPYLISDFGVSVGFNKNMGVVTVGVKNVFDTFYYDYYNNDRSAVVNENRFVIGRGRTVFVEGQFKY